MSRWWIRASTASVLRRSSTVVTKLDPLARSLPDARDILDELTRAEREVQLGGSVHDPVHLFALPSAAPNAS